MRQEWTDQDLAARLRAEPLEQPGEALLERTRAALRAHQSPAAEAVGRWRQMLAAAQRQFEELLRQPSSGSLALVTRDATPSEAAVSGDLQAALGHAVKGDAVHGQVFLLQFESPHQIEVLLQQAGGVAVCATVTDVAGRFEFAAVPPGEHELLVPALGLRQPVTVAP